MARTPSKLHDDHDGWVGARVRYAPRGGGRAEYGYVQRMASGKSPACFVLYDSDLAPKLTYISDLEKL